MPCISRGIRTYLSYRRIPILSRGLTIPLYAFYLFLKITLFNNKIRGKLVKLFGTNLKEDMY